MTRWVSVRWPTAPPSTLPERPFRCGNVIHGFVAIRRGHSITPCVFKRNTVNRRNDVDLIWSPPHDEKRLNLRKVRRLNILEWGAERNKGTPDALGVIRIGADENICVLGSSHSSVKSEGITAYNEIFSACLVQGVQQIDQVVVALHLHLQPSKDPMSNSKSLRRVLAGTWPDRPRLDKVRRRASSVPDVRSSI